MYFPPAEAEALIATLREELQQHGMLLGMLEMGQKTPAASPGGSSPELHAEIRENLFALHALRQRRQDEVRSFTGMGQAAGTANAQINLQGLLPHFPAVLAPLIRGLVEEVNDLIERVNCLANKAFAQDYVCQGRGAAGTLMQ